MAWISYNLLILSSSPRVLGTFRAFDGLQNASAPRFKATYFLRGENKEHLT